MEGPYSAKLPLNKSDLVLMPIIKYIHMKLKSLSQMIGHFSNSKINGDINFVAICSLSGVSVAVAETTEGGIE